MKKGFTLVEMLGVITIIALLALIIFPIVNKQLNRSKEELYKVQIENIENAAKSYGADNINLLPYVEGGEKEVTLEELIEGGYLDDGVENPKTGKKFSKDSVVKITYTSNKLNYEYIIS